MTTTNVSPRKKIFQLRLSDMEYERLKQKSQEQGITPSEFLRDYIKSLPKE